MIDTLRPAAELEIEAAELAASLQAENAKLEALGDERTAVVNAARSSVVSAPRRVDHGVAGPVFEKEPNLGPVDNDRVDVFRLEQIDEAIIAANRRCREVEQRQAEIAGELKMARRYEESLVAARDVDAVAIVAEKATAKVREFEALAAELPSRREAAIMAEDAQALIAVEKDLLTLPSRLATAKTGAYRAQLALAKAQAAAAQVRHDEQQARVAQLEAAARQAREEVQRAQPELVRAAGTLNTRETFVLQARRRLDEHVASLIGRPA